MTFRRESHFTKSADELRRINDVMTRQPYAPSPPIPAGPNLNQVNYLLNEAVSAFDQQDLITAESLVREAQGELYRQMR
jgi:hypothetical protein